MNAKQVTLRTMTDEEYEEATQRREAEGARELAEFVSEEQAWERVREGTAFYLPRGRETEGHYLVVAEDASGAVVGEAWLGPDPQEATATADAGWVYDIVVYEQFRRQGYGSAILAAVEKLAADKGMTRVGLNVVGSNTAAIELYRRSGYAVSSMVMHKKVR